MSSVLTIVSDGIALVTLNRPEAMNALSATVRADLDQALLGVESDERVRAIILTGAGEKAFCAGLDLRELATDPLAIRAANGVTPETNPVLAVERCRKPIIGAINGVAITGGLELAIATDVLIASTNARFADTHARVGVMPGWHLSQRLSRMIGCARAKRMALTGNFVDAATAERWGLVSEVLQPDALLPAAFALAKDMASLDPTFLCEYKALIDDGYQLTLEDGLALEAERSTAANSKITVEQIADRRVALQERGRHQ